MSQRRIAIIDDADALNEEGANALLKTLEEPPPGSLLILIGTSADRQLPTIRSRSQLVRFRPLEEALLARLVVEQGILAEGADAQRLARLSEGSLQRARELADPAWDAFRPAWLELLAGADWNSVCMARSAVEFVDAAGKEAPARRARARLVVDCTIGFYRQLARGLAGASTGEDDQLAQAAARAVAHWRWDAEAASTCIDRSLEALEQIDRNAYLPLVVECWIDELAQLTQGRPVMVWER